MFCKDCGKKLNTDERFCTNCGKPIDNIVVRSGRVSRTKKTVVVVLLIVLVLIFVYLNSNRKNSSIKTIQQDIASSVVNIWCEDALGWDSENVSGGSGTIITEDGLVITNAHIIPSGENESMDEKSCIVTLPDPVTGTVKEMYYAKPIVASDISEKYDLAFIQIDDVYYDQEEGKAYGEYPKKFPAYDTNLYCKTENVVLGEQIRIYGYPAISGGYALTITDGLVSSLLTDDGLIITSAKISHGNSGGLAVDEDGCRIGIPSMVSSDDAESLGVIISNDLIFDFIDEVNAKINSYGL